MGKAESQSLKGALPMYKKRRLKPEIKQTKQSYQCSQYTCPESVEIEMQSKEDHTSTREGGPNYVQPELQKTKIKGGDCD